MTDGCNDHERQADSALNLSREALAAAIADRATLYPDNAAMVADFADLIMSDFKTAKGAGRDKVLMICPVGPVGQYDHIARAAVRAGVSLADMTWLIMDEYLTDAGEWISADDPLSFRGHMMRALAPLPEAARPTVAVPDPADPGAVPRLIDRMGGVDVAYAGVGITGHLAFNDPIPGLDDPDLFAALPTRVVSLSEHTRTINSVTAARGNIERIPRSAVTVGMQEILSARRLRIFMNREWQCAAIRRLACGPVTARFPASLVRRHPDWSLHVVDTVLDSPEPGLR